MRTGGIVLACSCVLLGWVVSHGGSSEIGCDHAAAAIPLSAVTALGHVHRMSRSIGVSRFPTGELGVFDIKIARLYWLAAT
jgi:hypothetical protein